MSSFWKLAAALFTLALASTPLAAARQAAGTDPKPAPAPTEREFERVWKRLSAAEKRELCEWFRQEVLWLDTFQVRLLSFVLEHQERDPGTWPAAEPALCFDPATHAPAGIVPRQALSATSSLVKQKRERFLAQVPEARLASAWVYDYGARELRRTADPHDPERVFANALAGFPPDLDLAQALIEMQLDDGVQQAALRAFDHAYTDRDGKVYTSLTLYDAWCSGSAIEMPDVDCLGIVHTVLDDWSTWKAPVRDQDSLYARIAELFQDARRHRGLRHALAECYLVGDPALRDGYAATLDELHALWDSAASTPAQLRERLPAPAAWQEFLADWSRRCRSEPELRPNGVRRRVTLESDAREVRAALARVVQAFEAARK